MTKTRTDNQNRPVTLPWRMIIDSAEQSAWTFEGLKADAKQQYRPIIVETVERCLGRHPYSYGDYSLEAADGSISAIGYFQIERKSVEDLQSTILGFGDGHRERFESELENLHRVRINGGVALVIVEGSREEVIRSAPAHGIRTAQQNAKTLMRSIMRYEHDYLVQWNFWGSRRLAECAAFRHAEMFWRDHFRRSASGGWEFVSSHQREMERTGR